MRQRFLMAAPFALALTLLSGSAQAVVFGPSNFGFSGYPEPRCYEPSVPFSRDEFAWRTFQSETREYIDCVNRYIEAGDNDVERIQEAQAKAHRDAEDFLVRARQR